jgi:myotubularin-related protein 1/2
MAKGGGYEDTDNYKGSSIHFCDIQNIHAMRDSLSEVREICMQLRKGDPRDSMLTVDESFTHAMVHSGWLKHVRHTLAGAGQIVHSMHRKCSNVLVHCSDGWDRTAQLSALAQIMMDPYYRTIEGFAVLVEKEWVQFGHKFHHRIAQAAVSTSEASPIFLQFLDCVWQLLQQFPFSFEFNENLLSFLATELSACKFGNFLHNNMFERLEAQVKTRTVSIWTYVLARKPHFASKMYKPVSSSEWYGRADIVLDVSVDARIIQLWPWYYRQDLRFSGKLKTLTGALQTMASIQARKIEWLTQELQRQVDRENALRGQHGLELVVNPVSSSSALTAASDAKTVSAPAAALPPRRVPVRAKPPPARLTGNSLRPQAPPPARLSTNRPAPP